MKNIVDNSNQHCDFCKRMNTSQEPFNTKTFESNEYHENINGELHSIELEPDYLIGNT